MKRRKWWVGILVMTLVFGTMLTGCPTETDEPPSPVTPVTYTVWTDITSYSNFSSTFQTTLEDGYYIRLEFTDAQWNQIAPSLTSEGKYNWTADQIYNYFIGRGFGQTEANQQKAWLITINHGFSASRTGSIVDMILK
jgi:hypothetical protein